MKKGQSRWTVNIGHTRRRQIKQKNRKHYVLDTTIRKQAQIT